MQTTDLFRVLSFGVIAAAGLTPVAARADGVLVPTPRQFVTLDRNTALSPVSDRVVGVFVRDAAGLWREQANRITLTDPPPQLEEFGTVANLQKDTAVLTSYEGSYYVGRLHVFVRNANGVWKKQATLADYNALPPYDAWPQVEVDFGRSFALDGDTLVASSQGYTEEDAGPDLGGPTGTFEKHVVVFVRNSTGVWKRQAYVDATVREPFDDEYGSSIALHGDTLYVGAAGARNAAGIRTGAVFVFQRNSAGKWSQKATLTPTGGREGDQFGREVATQSADGIAIAAPQDDTYGESSGAVYIFAADSTGKWSQKQKLYALDRKAGEYFGDNLDHDGSKLLVGGRNAAYIFKQATSGSWSQFERLASQDVPFHEARSFSFGTALIGSSHLYELAPDPVTIDPVSGDDCINLAESKKSLVVMGAKAEPGATVTVALGSARKTAIAQETSAWSVTFTAANVGALPEGTSTVTAFQKDIPGGVSPTTTRPVCKDTILAKPVINPVTADNKVVAAERNAGFQIRGVAESGAAMTVAVGALTKRTTATGGQWAVSLSPAEAKKLAKDTLSVKATAVDLAGNTANGSRSFINK